MGNKVRRSMRVNAEGFTIVELLIAMVMAGIAMGAIYGVFISSNRSYHTQDKVADAQQRARVGLYFMVRDIRLAGFDPSASAGAGIEEATATKLRFTADRGRDTTGTLGLIDELAEERLTYEFDNANNRIRRGLYEGTGSENWQTLINNVNNVTFTYLDVDGNTIATPVAAADLEDIRVVVISLTVQDNDAQGNTFTRTLNKRANCRNLNF